MAPSTQFPQPLGIVPKPVRTRRGPTDVVLGEADGLSFAVDETFSSSLGDWFRAQLLRLHGITTVPVQAPGRVPGGMSLHRRDGELALTVPAVQGVDPRSQPSDDERYHLRISSEGAVLGAMTSEGAFRALATLLQLIHTVEGTVCAPEVEIEDGPAFAWRGLSLDVARHFFTVHEVEQVIDLLALYKFNVLHLHLTDSEGWRLESTVRPALTAGSTDHYTQGEFRHLVDYATARYIVIIPEIDVPGHALSAFSAYPDLQGPTEPIHPWVRFLDPEVDEAMAFTQDVLSELVTLAPGPFVHIGCDEPFGMPEAAYERFVRLAHDQVRRAGRRVVAWQEAARSDALGGDDVLQYWIGPDNDFDPEHMKRHADAALRPIIDQVAATFALAPGDVPRAVRRGVPVLISSNSYLYLDRGYAEQGSGPVQESLRGRVGFRAYERRSLAAQFDWYPSEMPDIVNSGAAVAGIEAALWCETVTTFDDLAFLLLPRLAGIAEKAWTSEHTTWDDYQLRIAPHRELWTMLGFGAAFEPAGDRPA